MKTRRTLERPDPFFRDDDDDDDDDRFPAGVLISIRENPDRRVVHYYYCSRVRITASPYGLRNTQRIHRKGFWDPKFDDRFRAAHKRVFFFFFRSKIRWNTIIGLQSSSLRATFTRPIILLLRNNSTNKTNRLTRARVLRFDNGTARLPKKKNNWLSPRPSATGKWQTNSVFDGFVKNEQNIVAVAFETVILSTNVTSIHRHLRTLGRSNSDTW